MSDEDTQARHIAARIFDLATVSARDRTGEKSLPGEQASH